MERIIVQNSENFQTFLDWIGRKSNVELSLFYFNRKSSNGITHRHLYDMQTKNSTNHDHLYAMHIKIPIPTKYK